MSLEDKYRASSDYREILRILQKASALQENFFWQTHAMGRTIVPMHHFEIDFVAREVVVFFDSSNYRIERELPLYVKLDYRSCVFKVTEFRESQSAIHFAFPKELRTLELRNFPRHHFANDEHTVGVRPSLNNRDQGHELQARVTDISPYGLGLIISEQNRPFMKNNRILWVTQLGKTRLAYPVLAEVAYISSEVEVRYQRARRQKELKVGLRLSGVIPDDIYQSFLQ